MSVDIRSAVSKRAFCDLAEILSGSQRHAVQGLMARDAGRYCSSPVPAGTQGVCGRRPVAHADRLISGCPYQGKLRALTQGQLLTTSMSQSAEHMIHADF